MGAGKGSLNSHFGGTQQPNRVMDEVRVYSTALAESEVPRRCVLRGD